MKKFIKHNTYCKLLLLIIGTSVLFVLLYISLYIYTIQQEKEVYKTANNQFNNEISSLFELNSKTHIATIVDVTYWDDLVHFTKTKDKKWFNKYIVGEFESYEVDYIGIYGLDKHVIVKNADSEIKTVDFIPKDEMDKLYDSKLSRFYLKIPEGVIEVFGATINPSNDPKKNKTNPSGYFFMARLLNEKYFKNLEKISSSKIEMVTDNFLKNDNEDLLVVSLDLKDWKKENISKLLFKRPFNLDFKSTKRILSIIIIVFIIKLFFYLYFSRRWVYFPLKIITDILETGNETSINKLKKTPGEFSYIGNLFEENSNQRKQLEISKKKAEESDKLKSSFLANLSHEIRTPMNAIIGFSDLLANENLDKKDKSDYLKIIKNSGSNLVSIIEDLIEMSKIDAKQISPNFKGFDLDKCIKELYETIKVTIPKEKKIDFHIQECENSVKRNVITDELKLRQIITNLITNSIKYTSKGFIIFGYEVDEKSKKITFTVKDSGIGINENNLKVIFDRFRRIEDDFSAELSGLGLGLAISKAYVEMLGGSISVSSKVGVGSVFSFTIPLKYDNNQETSSSVKSINNLEINGNKTILIAEDDNINFLLLKKILQIRNYTVIRAVNGQEAVELCSNNPEINLVFMDIKMPILDGYAALKKIKKIKPNLPIIAQTAHSSSEDKARIIGAGFIDFIIKPLDKEKIFELIDKVFEIKK